MTTATEYDFNTAVKKVAEENGFTWEQEQYVNMYCAENGSDCGSRCWEIAINTLEMIIDQGMLIKVASNDI